MTFMGELGLLLHRKLLILSELLQDLLFVKGEMAMRTHFFLFFNSILVLFIGS